MYQNPRFNVLSAVQFRNLAARHFAKATNKPIIDLTDPNAKELTKEEFLALSNVELDVQKLKPHQYKQHVTKPNESDRDNRNKNKYVPHSELIKFKGHIVKDLVVETGQKLMYQDRGVYKMNRQEYYRHFFNKNSKDKNSLDKQQEKYYKLLKNPPKIKEKRIRPSKYWYKNDYTPPTNDEISKLTANELKFTFMNQSRHCRSAGVIDNNTWNLLLERVLKLSNKIKLRKLMRYFQAIGNVQLDVNWRVKQLIDIIYKRRVEMKPKHYVYLFQALSRLRYQGLNLLDDLHEMMLCWSILRNNFLIKAANSLSKLGVGNELLAQPLQKVISHRIVSFTGSDCIKVKYITCLEMFTDDMLVAFLHKCDYNRTLFCHYTRHLEIVELYLRLMKPNVYERLSEATREFLKSSREHSTMKDQIGKASFDSDVTNNQDMEGYSLNDIDNVTNEAESAPLDSENPRSADFGRSYHEDFVKDVARILTLLNIEAVKGVIAGPFTLDLYSSERNLVIECCPPYQFYTQTGSYTTCASWRHKLIRAMGFHLVLVPYKKWYSLPSDNDKGAFLTTILPNHIA